MKRPLRPGKSSFLFSIIVALVAATLIYERRDNDVKGHESHDVMPNWYSQMSVECRVE